MGTPTEPSHLILASASERRRRILAGMGLAFEVVVPLVEEVCWPCDPRGTVAENALLKSAWCRHRHGEGAIISADTIVEFKGQCITKPASMADASAMLRLFSGAEQTVLTAVVFSEPAARPEVEVVASTVVFKALTATDIERYFAAVNPLDKAGGYDIDQHADIIIESFAGSRTNIMGLPEENVAAWLERRGSRHEGSATETP